MKRKVPPAPNKGKAEQLEMLRRKMLSEIADVSIVLLDLDGTIMTWNKGVEEVHGYTSDEIIGKHISIFYTEEERATHAAEKILDQARREGKANYTGKRLRKDGTAFWGSILLTAIHNDDGEVIGFAKLTRPIIAGSGEE